MELELKILDACLLIKPLDKSIETFNSRVFKTQISDLIGENQKFIILDFSQIDFIDSNGLGSLVSILKLLTSLQGRIVICAAKDSVKRVFNLTRLDQVIPLLPSLEEGLQFLQNNPNSKSLLEV